MLILYSGTYVSGQWARPILDGSSGGCKLQSAPTRKEEHALSSQFLDLERQGTSDCPGEKLELWVCAQFCNSVGSVD